MHLPTSVWKSLATGDFGHTPDAEVHHARHTPALGKPSHSTHTHTHTHTHIHTHQLYQNNHKTPTSFSKTMTKLFKNTPVVGKSLVVLYTIPKTPPFHTH